MFWAASRAGKKPKCLFERLLAPLIHPGKWGANGIVLSTLFALWALTKGRQRDAVKIGYRLGRHADLLFGLLRRQPTQLGLREQKRLRIKCGIIDGRD